MATYLIGDVHGCYHELIALLKQVNFSAGKDTLWLTGDLVSRGPFSLEVLRYVKSLGNNVRIVLGNHDLHLLAIHAGISHNKFKYHLTPLLQSPEVYELLYWLRCQPLLQIDKEKKLIMTHAGITPQWNLSLAKQCAYDVENILASDNFSLFLHAMYDNTPSFWSKDLRGMNRLRFISNAFTRMRYCFPNGKLELSCKGAPENAPFPLIPWFSFPRKINNYNVVFGHWSSLNKINIDIKNGIHAYALDTGCCWGGRLTCLRWEDKTCFFQMSYQRKLIKTTNSVSSEIT